MLSKARLKTALPAVSRAMSNASRIGTPEESNVPSVRHNRATVDFSMIYPSKGIRSEIQSTMNAPVLFLRTIFKNSHAAIGTAGSR